MRKLVKLILLCLIAYPIISIVSSCSEEEDCSMNARPMMQCYLYKIDGETERVVNDTLDSLTITAFGTDSIILNNQKRVHGLSLPLRYTADSTVLVFHYSKDVKIKKDTIVIRQKNTPYFLSMDCGYQMKQSITGRSYSRHLLDSIYIQTAEVSIYGTEILSSFIVINLVLCLLAGFPVQAQNSNRPPASNPPKEQKKEVDEEAFPLYNGVSVSVDLWGIGSKAFGSDFLSSEVAVDVNLKNRFFPIVELGYGGTDAWNDNGTHYKSNAPYFRIGMNYNALFKKKFKNYLFVGLRYAMSSFKYDIATLSVDDPIYGGGIGNPNQVDDIWGGSLPFNHKGMKGSMQWFEFCVGIRAHIWKELYMGWGLRFKFRTSSSTGEYGDPWYVPGFGKYGSNTMGVTYTITYKLPF